MTDSNCEHPAKRMKKEDPRKILDPFENVHLDVFELILQHLKSPDVLQASLVSPLWYNVTATSSKCMEKVHLTIIARNIVTEKFLRIADDLVGERKYQNIYLNNINSIYQEIFKILNGRMWKKVYFSETKFDSEKFYRFIKIVEPTVEDLSITYTSIQNIEQKQKPRFNFPKLKSLDLSKSNGILLDEISENCKTLQTLKVVQDAVKLHSAIRKILENNVDLKRLNLSQFSYREVFPDEFHYSFKLKSLCFSSIKKTTNDDRIRLLNFLKSQAKSLESLRLDEWNGIETLKFVFGMPKLNEITFDLIHAEKTIDWENVILPKNTSITSFYLESYASSNDHEYIKMFNTLFDALPNLKVLSLEVIKKRCLESIGARCKNLEEIDVQMFNVVDLPNPDCFPKIKKFQCADSVPKRLKQRINMKPAKERSNFEQLILAAVPSYNISQ